jgi:5-(carboxyamino)imidazole ribonucleotide synthase
VIVRTAPILPGSTLGVLGAGQLGRMFALAARRLGYRVHTYSTEPDAPAAQVADVAVVAPYDDLDQVAQFARDLDVLTFEFENVPAACAAAAEAETVVRPGGNALAIAQHRRREKEFLIAHGLPVTPFVPIVSEADLADAFARVGGRAVLKTSRLGYDGKGQIAIESKADLAPAWDTLHRHEAILEAFIDLDCEVSVVAARGVSGDVSNFDPIENVHRHHILDVSVAPAAVSSELARQAVDVTRAVLEALEYVGVLCVEFFVARDGRLLINEIAPRPHNSGHLTIDACDTSQFEQQVRAICGLPLGSPALRQPAAMANLLGDLWSGGEPDWAAALSKPGIKLHLYGKRSARPGRKMGHLTATAATRDEARGHVLNARAALSLRL